MRSAFFRKLVEAAKNDPRIWLVTGDLGFGVVEEFAAACPSQFVNAGVAEQSMTGLAAGLALSGAKVFTYSIANFPTLRCLEQVRNDVAYHGADVTMVAVGGGLAYGPLGISHHATEDIAVMRAIPGLAVAAPGDPAETERIMEELLTTGGPAYIRLGKSGEPVIHKACPPLPRGSSIVVRHGSDCALLCTGAILASVVEVSDVLATAGHSIGVVSMPWIEPIDQTVIQEISTEYRVLVTVEEHSAVGGLGSSVAEMLAGMPRHPPLLRLGLPRKFTSAVGSQDFLRKVYGLGTDEMVQRISDFIRAV